MLKYTDQNRGLLDMMNDTDDWDLVLDGKDQISLPSNDDLLCLDNLLGDSYDDFDFVQFAGAYLGIR